MKLTNARILGPDFTFLSGTLEIQNGVFTRIGEASSNGADAEEEKDVRDIAGLTAIPGLIDVHMHGYVGVACSDPDPEKLRKIGQALAKQGVTGYAATIGSARDERALGGIKANREACRLEEAERTGSRILGMHMEGPFLNPVKKGGMDPECIVPPTLERLQAYLEAAGDEDFVKLMTVAPEMPGAEEIIRYGTARGIKFSQGHTDATKEQSEKGLSWGVCRQTHTFNAVRALNHREIGALGVALTNDEVQCEMISDFVHLKKEICKLIYRAKGADRVTVISDSLSLAGLTQEQIPEGINVIVSDACYMPNGTLCGGIGNVMGGVRNLVSIGIPVEDAIKMASFNPARDLGMEDALGSIAVGKWADFVLVDDDLNVKEVYIGGERLTFPE